MKYAAAMMIALFSGIVATAPAQEAAGAISPAPEGYSLVFEDDFSKGMDRWVPTDPKAWKIVEEEGNPVLAAVRPSNYEPPVRSPQTIAWIKGLDVGDFVIEVDAKQTGREYGHRDLCVFFGKQDDTHFYYVHLATAADEHANSIFLVNGAPRVSIAKERTQGTDWGSDVWHKVRIKRTVADGRIEVFFDNMDQPVMIAEDATFTCGTIGLGSFDDVGRFDNLRIWSPPAR